MITIVNPPNPPDSVSNKDMMGGMGQTYAPSARQKIPPIDIPYAAAVIRSSGAPVQVIDCLGCDWDLSRLILELHEQKPNMVAIRTSTPTFDWDMRVAHIIKMVMETKIIIFGSHVTIFPDQTIQQPYVDAIILGEPELTFLDIAKQAGFSNCQGVWYKEGDKVVRNEARKPFESLDKLPFPAWDLMPYQAYDGIELMRNLKPFVTILTSRGCPYGCAYCPYPVTQGRKLRVRSPKNVVAELEWLAQTLGVKAVLFRDPEFALQRERVVGICEGILERGLHLAWRCETRMEDMDEPLIALMAKAGCIGLNMGVESADEEVLRNVKRKTMPFEDRLKVIRACRKHGLETFCFFVLGLPGETRASALRTIDYALKLNPTFLQFTVATPYPGTELRSWAERKGFIENEALSAITGYNVAMRNEHMTVDEIRQLQAYAYEARDMKWSRVARRIFGNSRQAGAELRRWLSFQTATYSLKLSST